MTGALLVLAVLMVLTLGLSTRLKESALLQQEKG